MSFMLGFSIILNVVLLYIIYGAYLTGVGYRRTLEILTESANANKK